MQAEKGGEKAYMLLRDALSNSGKIGIAKVVIKVRQHLAAIKSQQNGLMLELMHFPEELIDVSEFKAPAAKTVTKPEMNMANKLVESMTAKWNPDRYHDDYRENLLKLIEEKVQHGPEKLPARRKAQKATNVIDLVSVLQKSIKETRGKHKPLKKAA